MLTVFEQFKSSTITIFYKKSRHLNEHNKLFGGAAEYDAGLRRIEADGLHLLVLKPEVPERFSPVEVVHF